MCQNISETETFMAAHVEHEFANHFELDEEKLRRIYSILRKRVPENTPSAIKFKITRDDNLIYSTENIDDIINEPNDSTTKINNIDINFLHDSLELTVSLNKKTGSSIKISGEDRDNVFLLYSELKDYISKEVSNIRNLSWFTPKLLLPLFMFAFMFYMSYLMWSFKGSPEDEINNIISHADINEKLNYLISRKNKEVSDPPLASMFTFLTIMTLTPLLPLSKLYHYLRPTNTFSFGKEIQVLKNRRKTTSNIFWVVIVGGIVSLALAYIGPKIF